MEDIPPINIISSIEFRKITKNSSWNDKLDSIRTNLKNGYKLTGDNDEIVEREI